MDINNITKVLPVPPLRKALDYADKSVKESYFHSQIMFINQYTNKINEIPKFTELYGVNTYYG